MKNSSLGSTASFKVISVIFREILLIVLMWQRILLIILTVWNSRLLLPGAWDPRSSGMWDVTSWWTPNVSRSVHYLKRSGSSHPVTRHLITEGQTSYNTAVSYSPLNILTKHDSLRYHQYQLPITDYTDFKLKPNPEARYVEAVHSPHITYDVTESLLVSLL
jgi:hypothetical protein